MTEAELQSEAEAVLDELPDDAEVGTDEIVERLEDLREYDVPIDEARRTVVNSILDAEGIEPEEMGGNEDAQVGDIDQGDQWLDVTVKVVELWDPSHESIGQTGLVGDESGTIKFTKWEDSGLPALEEGEVYRLANVVTDEYEGRLSITLNSSTQVEQLDEDFEVGDNAIDVTGTLVDVQSGSGLIKRCPEDDCTRVLQNGRCSEHGDVDRTFDLRIKAVLDDGTEVHEALFDQAATERLTGIELEEAIEMAKDALDTSVVADEIKEQTIGRYYRVSGPTMGRYVLVDEHEQLEGPTDDDIEAALIQARSI